MAKHDKDRKRVKQDQRASRSDDQPSAGGHHAATAHGQPAKVDASLPASREELTRLHAAARRRRAAAPYNSPEHHAAIDEIGRIEIRIADVERATTPPRG